MVRHIYYVMTKAEPHWKHSWFFLESDYVSATYYSLKKWENKTSSLIPPTLFSLRCTRGSCEAVGTHQTSTYSPMTIKHLSHLACLHPAVEEIAVKCLKTGGDSLLHIAICCKSLPSQMFLTGSINLEITGPHTTKRTFDWLWTTVHTPDLPASYFRLLDLWSSTWLASDRQQTSTYSKLPPSCLQMLQWQLCLQRGLMYAISYTRVICGVIDIKVLFILSERSHVMFMSQLMLPSKRFLLCKSTQQHKTALSLPL